MAKEKRQHESQHVPVIIHDQIHVTSSASTQQQSSVTSEADDMYSYKCSFLEYSMIIENFFDAIREGDGERILRCWKFQLLYLKHDADCFDLTLLFQINLLLSPRDAHRLVWNRTTSSKSGNGNNIPLDLALEFMNRILKKVVLKLGPNATNHKCMDRYCKGIDVSKAILEKFDHQ